MKQRGLRVIGGTFGLVCLRPLGGDAVAVESGLDKQIKSVRCETELMLRNGQAAFVSFHGVSEAAGNGLPAVPRWVSGGLLVCRVIG